MLHRTFCWHGEERQVSTKSSTGAEKLFRELKCFTPFFYTITGEILRLKGSNSLKSQQDGGWDRG